MRLRAAGLSLAVAAASAPGVLQAQQPLSAIDWLSEVITAPLVIPKSEAPAPLPREEAVTKGIATETIAVTALDAPSVDAVGLLPASVSNLPADLWGPSSSTELAQALRRIDPSTLLPSVRALLITLVLAELRPPFDSTDQGTLFLARIEALKAIGATEQAFAMLDRARPDTPERFALWFDLSLLLGAETQACQTLAAAPGLAPSIEARVFCLARLRDWDAAQLSYETARVLGQLPPEMEALLERFLQDGSGEGAAELAVPKSPSPLVFHMFEAIGEPLPTITLPLSYAHADLRDTTGWKAQIEAAERLAQRGAIPANKLLGLYTERRPAASGGVWDRAEVVQAFDQALASGNIRAISLALPLVWEALAELQLEPVFAELYGDRLRAFALEPRARPLVLKTGLLTPDFEDIAASWTATDPTERFLQAVATGALAEATPQGARQEAVAEGLLAGVPPSRFLTRIERRAIGLALLEAIALSGQGATGDYAKMAEALALFRFLGLENVARRAALELLVLGRPG